MVKKLASAVLLAGSLLAVPATSALMNGTALAAGPGEASPGCVHALAGTDRSEGSRGDQVIDSVCSPANRPPPPPVGSGV